MVDRWLDVNRRAQEAGDWRPMADMFTEDATYGWNMGPREEFMAIGREEIRDYALGMEMGATAEDIALPVHAHPTLSETLMECAEVFYGHATHTFTKKKAAE